MCAATGPWGRPSWCSSQGTADTMRPQGSDETSLTGSTGESEAMRSFSHSRSARPAFIPDVQTSALAVAAWKR